MRRAAWLVMVGALVALGPGVLGHAPDAQAQRWRGSAASPDRRGPAEANDRREQIKKKVRALRAFRLTDELALDEPTAARLFPVLSRYDDDIDKLLEQRVDIQRRLRRAGSLRDPRAVNQLIDEAIANQRSLWDLDERRVVALRKILTPAQAAKLLVVLPSIERRIQRQLRRAIVQQRSGPGLDDVDDDEEFDEEVTRPARRRREAPLAPRGDRSNAPGNTPPCDPLAGPCQ